MGRLSLWKLEAVAYALLLTLTYAVKVEWKETFHKAYKNDDVRVVCEATAIPVTALTTIVIYRQYSNGDKITISSNGLLVDRGVYKNSGRYEHDAGQFHYYQDQGRAELELNIKGAQPSDSMSLGCRFSGESQETTANDLLELTIIGPVSFVHIQSIQPDGSVITAPSESPMTMTQGQVTGFVCEVVIPTPNIEPTVNIYVGDVARDNNLFNVTSYTESTESNPPGITNYTVTYKYIYNTTYPDHAFNNLQLTCEAHTENFEEIKRTDAVFVFVEYFPIIQCDFDEMYAIKGEEANTTCVIYGYPATTITMTYGPDGEGIDIIEEDGAEFELHIMQVQDSIDKYSLNFKIKTTQTIHFTTGDTGYKYKIRAENSLGYTEKNLPLYQGRRPGGVTGLANTATLSATVLTLSIFLCVILDI